MVMAKHKDGLTRRQLLGVAGGAAGLAVTLGAKRAVAGTSKPDPLETRLVTEYGASVPIVNAGMAFVGTPELAIAVTNAGGIGMFGAAPLPAVAVAPQLAAIAGAVGDKPYGVDFIVAPGFTTQDHIDAAAGTPIVVFHWDIPDPAWVEQLHEAGTRVWIQVGDVNNAQRALAAGADAIIAQGSSAGGHNHNSTIPTLSLVQQIRARAPGVMVLASGGICDGVTLARALRAGAEGGWMGTRFVAATESYAHPEYKQRLIEARSISATAFTTAFGPEFPGAQQRVLRNTAVVHPTSTTPATIGTTLLGGQPYTMPNHSAIVPTRDTSGDFDQMDMPAGSESVLAVNSVKSAAQIIADVIAEARLALC